MINPVEKNNNSETPAPQRKSGFSLAGDKYLLLVAVLLLIGVALSWGALNQIKKQVGSNLQKTLQNVLYTTYETINIWAGDRIDAAELLVDRPDVKQLIKELLSLPRDRETLVNSHALQQLRIIIRPFIEKHSALGMFVITPDGINVGSMRDENLAEVNFCASYGYYMEELLKGEPQLVLPIRSDVALPGITGKLAQGEPTMFIGVPVTDDDGSVIAAFTLRINPSLDFTRIVQLARTGLPGDSYLFNKNGKLISESRFDDQLRSVGLVKADERAILNLKLLDPGGNLLEGFQPATLREKLPLTLLARKALDGESGFNLEGYRDYRGVQVVGGWRWDEKYNFGQAFEIDVSEAYGLYFAIRQTVIGLLSIMMVLFFGFAVGLVRRKRQAEAMNIQLTQEIVGRQKSEDKFRVLLESSPDGMVIVNKAGDIILINRQIEKLFGYLREELLGRKIELLMSERFAVEHTRHRDLFFESPHIRPMGLGLALRGMRKDGREFPLDISLSPIETGGDIAAIASIRDISMRKDAEEKIRRSEANLAAAQRIALLGSWELDLVNNRFHWSDEVFRIFGLKPEEVEPTYEAFLQFVHPDDRQTLEKSVQDVLQGKGSYSLTHRILCSDGRVCFVHEQGEVIVNDTGQVIQLVGTVQDITERKRIEADIQLRSARLTSHNRALQNLARINLSGLETALNVATMEAAAALDAERVSVWLFNEDRSELFCKKLFISSKSSHEKGAVLKVVDLPNYFKAVEGNWILTVDDVHNNSATSELEGYLKPLGITSMLDVGIFSHSELVGVVCVEHVGSQREWAEEEKAFVRSIADIVTLSMEASERQRAEKELEKHKEHLEELVAERTVELQEREETLRTITSSAQNAIIMIDNDGNISFWNEAAEIIFGWQPEEIMGQNLHKVMVPQVYHKDHFEAFSHFQKTGKGDGIGEVQELFATRKNGEEFPVELALSAVKIKGKWNLIGIVSDISDRKQAEEELRRNLDELERFSKLATGREQKMILLKEEVNELLSQLAREKKYRIVK